MSELEDIKLKALLHEMKLESPEPNFSVRVMNKIFEESSLLEKVKKEKVLGKGFWIILIMFVILFTAILVFNQSAPGGESEISNMLSGLGGENVSNGYQSIFDKIGSIPLSIAGIMLASSILLFVDRFISANSKLF